MVVQVNSCCCGLSLRTGTIIIAVLGLLGGISFLIQGIFDASDPHGPGMSTNATITTITKTVANTTGEEDVAGEDGFNIVQAIYGFVEILVNILLLVGAIKNSAKIIYPWIIVNVILCILGVILFLGIGILIAISGLMAAGVGYICWALLITAIHIYCILVVNSFHSTLKAAPLPRA